MFPIVPIHLVKSGKVNSFNECFHCGSLSLLVGPGTSGPKQLACLLVLVEHLGGFFINLFVHPLGCAGNVDEGFVVGSLAGFRARPISWIGFEMFHVVSCVVLV